jgi:hypothetical protein
LLERKLLHVTKPMKICQKKKIVCVPILSTCAFFRKERVVSCIERDADSLCLLGYWPVIKAGTDRGCSACVRDLGRIGWINETGPEEMSSFGREEAHACLTRMRVQEGCDWRGMI